MFTRFGGRARSLALSSAATTRSIPRPPMNATKIAGPCLRRRLLAEDTRVELLAKRPSIVQPAPTYGVEDPYEEETNGCFWVKVKADGTVGGIAEIGGETAVQTSKFCCVLKQLPESEWVTVSLEDCQTTMVTF